MTISTRYVLMASMDVTPEVEALFNEVYDTEHVPNLLQVPGVHSVTRMKGEPARFAIAGAVRNRRSTGPGKNGPNLALTIAMAGIGVSPRSQRQMVRYDTPRSAASGVCQRWP